MFSHSDLQPTVGYAPLIIHGPVYVMNRNRLLKFEPSHLHRFPSIDVNRVFASSAAQQYFPIGHISQCLKTKGMIIAYIRLIYIALLTPPTRSMAATVGGTKSPRRVPSTCPTFHLVPSSLGFGRAQ